MYKIEIDKPHGMLLLTLSGFWTAEEVRNFIRDEEAAVAKLGCKPGTHCVLVDVSDFAVQMQEVSNILREFIHEGTAKSIRIAVLGTIGLVALQSKRVASRGLTRFFDKHDDAISWLKND